MVLRVVEVGASHHRHKLCGQTSSGTFISFMTYLYELCCNSRRFLSSKITGRPTHEESCSWVMWKVVFDAARVRHILILSGANTASRCEPRPMSLKKPAVPCMHTCSNTCNFLHRFILRTGLITGCRTRK